MHSANVKFCHSLGIFFFMKETHYAYHEECEMEENENESRPTEPEEIVIWMNKRSSFHYIGPVIDFKCHFCYN